jgi:hypothetical protein
MWGKRQDIQSKIVEEVEEEVEESPYLWVERQDLQFSTTITINAIQNVYLVINLYSKTALDA